MLNSNQGLRNRRILFRSISLICEALGILIALKKINIKTGDGSSIIIAQTQSRHQGLSRVGIVDNATTLKVKFRDR